MEEEYTDIESAEDEELEESSTSEDSEDTTDETPEEGQEEQEEERPKKKGVQDRINELTWQREEEKRQRAEEKARADRLESMLQEVVNKQPKPEPETFPEAPPLPPDRFQFDDDDQYSQAMQAYQNDLSRFVQGQNKRAQEELVRNIQQQKQQQSIGNFLSDTMNKGKAKYEDFDRVGFIPQGMEQVFAQTENPADLAYVLGSNHAERQRILSLNPAQAVFEIAKLDARLSAKATKQTNAPPPVKPIGGKSPANSDWMNDPNISMEEWTRRREKQLRG